MRTASSAMPARRFSARLSSIDRALRLAKRPSRGSGVLLPTGRCCFCSFALWFFVCGGPDGSDSVKMAAGRSKWSPAKWPVSSRFGPRAYPSATQLVWLGAPCRGTFPTRGKPTPTPRALLLSLTPFIFSLLSLRHVHMCTSLFRTALHLHEQSTVTFASISPISPSQRSSGACVRTPAACAMYAMHVCQHRPMKHWSYDGMLRSV